MKNLLTTFATIIFLATSTFATSTPDAEIVSSENVTVTMEAKDFFQTAAFNTESSTLDFTTVNEISVIQIYGKDGKIAFQLPVMSNHVQINKNLFSEGNQKLGFVLAGESQVYFSDVTIK